MDAGASNTVFIFLDEAGDLGWKFDEPYRHGGSSRFLTISAVCVPASKRQLPKRLIRKIYERFAWSPKVEHKWASMNTRQRSTATTEIKALCNAHPDIFLHAITVKKQNVQEHIRADGNKLYNYMIRLALLPRMAGYGKVVLIPDPRSIKVKSGNSLHDYLQTELWFSAKSGTILETMPQDSAECKGIQLADVLAGIVQAHFEDNLSSDFHALEEKLVLNRLFF